MQFLLLKRDQTVFTKTHKPAKIIFSNYENVT